MDEQSYDDGVSDGQLYCQTSMEQMQELTTKQIKEIERLRKALDKYGNHKQDCRLIIGGSAYEQCTCGFEQVLKEGE